MVVCLLFDIIAFSAGVMLDETQRTKGTTFSVALFACDRVFRGSAKLFLSSLLLEGLLKPGRMRPLSLVPCPVGSIEMKTKISALHPDLTRH